VEWIHLAQIRDQWQALVYMKVGMGQSEQILASKKDFAAQLGNPFSVYFNLQSSQLP
jgi:hypothetical protein